MAKKAVRVRRKMPENRFCMFCGKVFPAVRSDAQFCSARCRQRAVRAIGKKGISDNPDRL